MALWGGRFTEKSADAMSALSRSVHFDWRLAPYEIEVNLVHLENLINLKIISKEDGETIRKALLELAQDIGSGKFSFSDEDEDVHSAIERGLTAKVGAIGGSIRAGRSRNDLVVTDFKLYLIDHLLEIATHLADLINALNQQAVSKVSVIAPGFTHTQHAQPISFGQELSKHSHSLMRDLDRILDWQKRNNLSPFGAGALSGSSIQPKPNESAKALGFSGVIANSIDAVSDRDFVAEALFIMAMIGVHLSRIGEEFVLWSSSEFNFVQISDQFSTGSSIMPQKKNPDVPELARGKTGRVYGDLISLLTLMKGQPLAYNKDNQEDKEPLFDAVDTVQDTLRIFADMVPHIEVKADVMKAAAEEGFATATDLADYLVKKGLAFRDAHEAVAHAVKACVGRNCMLTDLSLAELRFACGLDNRPELMSDDVFALLTVDGSVQSRQHAGGTAPSQVLAAIKRARSDL